MNNTALVGAIAGSFVCAGAAVAQTPVPQYDARTFYDTIAIFRSSFSHDEKKILFTSDRSGVFNVYSISIDGGEAIQYTKSATDANMSIGWFPSDNRFLFTADQGGNELNHIYVYEKAATTRDLTPGENLKARFAGWADDDTGFYVMTNERDPEHFDLYRYDVGTYERKLVFENNDGYLVSAISPDERWIALMKVRNNADNNIFLLDTTDPSTELLLVTPHEGNVDHGVEDFSPGSGRLLFTSDADNEFQRLWAYHIASGEVDVIEEADWDIVFSGFSRSGNYRSTGVNEDAVTKITVREVATGKPLALPKFPSGEITGVNISRSDHYLAFYVNGATSPSNLYILDLETHEHRKLTDSLNPKIDERYLVQPEVVRYESFDGLKIPAILYKPHQASAETPVPALVWVHGGPGGQSRIGYSAALQFLLNHGYAILAVNNRGSSGYGKTFYHLDDLNHGEDDLQDCIYGRKHLETLDWVDGDKIGIIGGSYGGYMVAAALAFEPEAFDVGINIFGVTNWLRTLESIPPWWADFRESLYAEIGDPETDRERLYKISPLFHADNIIKPLLVVQGANDPRVLKVESDEIVAAARENGVPVEYVVFDDEGHGFRSKENRITAANSYLEFLDRYLKN